MHYEKMFDTFIFYKNRNMDSVKNLTGIINLARVESSLNNSQWDVDGMKNSSLIK